MCHHRVIPALIQIPLNQIPTQQFKRQTFCRCQYIMRFVYFYWPWLNRTCLFGHSYAYRMIAKKDVVNNKINDLFCPSSTEYPTKFRTFRLKWTFTCREHMLPGKSADNEFWCRLDQKWIHLLSIIKYIKFFTICFLWNNIGFSKFEKGFCVSVTMPKFKSWKQKLTGSKMR